MNNVCTKKDSCLKVLLENNPLKQIFWSSLNCGLTNKWTNTVVRIIYFSHKNGESSSKKDLISFIQEESAKKKKNDEQVLHQHSRQDCWEKIQKETKIQEWNFSICMKKPCLIVDLNVV